MFAPLIGWIERQHPLPKRFYASEHADLYNENWGAWVGLEECMPLHMAAAADWHSYNKLRDDTRNYLARASDLICGLEGAWLDREERQMILDALGPPPPACLPIYMMSVRDETEEKLVYIGKTVADNRFTNGHHAALALLAPEYQHYEKCFYRCCVTFHFQDEYISLEWIEPDAFARELLDSVESQLIHALQPPLNIDKKEVYRAKKPFTLHIQNFTDSTLLDDKMIWP